MNIISTIITSLALGIISGIVYGLFFLSQRRRVLFYHDAISTKQRFLLTFVSALVRIFALALLWYYILLSPSIHFILLMITFLGAFWITILNKKA